MIRGSRSSSSLVAAQVAGIALAIGALYLTPPASGRLLLVPVLPLPPGALVREAVARGGRLVAEGPTPSSLVVEGTRASFLPDLPRKGVLVLAAPDLACGERTG